MLTDTDITYLQFAASIEAETRKVAFLTDQLNRSRDPQRRGWFVAAITRTEREIASMRECADHVIASAEAAARDSIVAALADLAAEVLRCDDPDCDCNG